MMVRNPEAVPEASAQTASDSIAGPQTSHSKLTRRGKQKRKRVDQDEVEVEAVRLGVRVEWAGRAVDLANGSSRLKMGPLEVDWSGLASLEPPRNKSWTLDIASSHGTGF